MNWQVLLLVISSNVDDLGVGFSLGLRVLVPWRAMLFIAALSGITMSVGLKLGSQISHTLLGQAPEYVSALIFAVLGIWFLKEGLTKGKENRAEGRSFKALKIKSVQDAEKQVKVNWKAALVLGLALGVDSIALGVSGGIAGYPTVATSLLAAATSLLFLWAGSRFGRTGFMRGLIGKRAEYASALLMFVLAVFQLTGY